jgi:hypothetical protein
MENLLEVPTQTEFFQPPHRPEITVELMQSEDRPLLVVMCGLGVDSTTILVRLKQLEIRPDVIAFSNVGAEKDATYAYQIRLEKWLADNDFPPLTIMQPPRPRDISLEAHLLRLGIFVSLSYGRRHSCSVAWKLETATRFLNTWEPYRKAKREGGFIVQAIGFNADENYRVERAEEANEKANGGGGETSSDEKKNTTGFQTVKSDDVVTWFPLIEMGLSRSDCVMQNVEAGLGFVPKSSCTVCAAMRWEEVDDLERTEPHRFFRCLMVEFCARNNEVVPHPKIRGIRYGEGWIDRENAAPYREFVEKAYHEFDLKRTPECGEKTGWQIKKLKVERFLNFFSSADNLRQYMENDYELEPLTIPDDVLAVIETNQGELF